jgi:hypothetical protein
VRAEWPEDATRAMGGLCDSNTASQQVRKWLRPAAPFGLWLETGQLLFFHTEQYVMVLIAAPDAALFFMYQPRQMTKYVTCN